LGVVAKEWEKSGKKRLAEVTKVLEKESFAADARKGLAKLDKELAKLGYDVATHEETRQQELELREVEEEYRKLESARELSKRIAKEIDGTRLGQKVTPLDRVGLYVPGGRASYPSSVLMNAIPAKVAGVGELIMVVPTPRGERNPLVLAAAYIAGVTRAFTIGGAQAVVHSSSLSLLPSSQSSGPFITPSPQCSASERQSAMQPP